MIRSPLTVPRRRPGPRSSQAGLDSGRRRDTLGLVEAELVNPALSLQEVAVALVGADGDARRLGRRWLRSSSSRATVRRGSLSGLNASQITAARGSRARPVAEDAAARAPVDPHHADALRARGTAAPACLRRRCARTGGRSARRACRPGRSRPSAAAGRSPYRRRRRSRCEPPMNQTLVGPVGRAGLAEQRPVEIAQDGRGAALDDAFEHVDDLIGGHRIDHLAGAERRPRHRPAVPVGRVAAVAGPRCRRAR